MRAFLCLVVTELALWQSIVANECSNGAIRITNGTIELISKSYYIAGGLQVCVDKKWATVCQHNWGQLDAVVACRQLGLSYLNSCVGSCFGNIRTNPAFYGFDCSGTESQLVDCQSNENAGCGQAAGVYCAINVTTLTMCGTIPEITTTKVPEPIPSTPIENIITTTSESTTINCQECTGEDSDQLMASNNQATEKLAPEQQRIVCEGTVEKALGVILGLFGMALVGVVICLIITCLQLHKSNSYNTSSPETNKNWSMDNNVYGMTEQSNTASATPNQEQTSLNIHPSAANQKPVLLSAQNDTNDAENNYDIITSEDNIMDDEMYSVPYDENITKKKNRKKKQTNEEENQVKGQEREAIEPDKLNTDPVYNIPETGEYKMDGQYNTLTRHYP